MLVSIRARPIGRAMLGVGSVFAAVIAFQSAPGQLAGRCGAPPRIRWTDEEFQSAPGQLAGRCRIGRMGRGGRQGVSIRARPIGRAMHHAPQVARGDLGVSIRARPIGRAMLVVARGDGRHCLFQSAPGQLAGRCMGSPEAVAAVLTFQSAPGQLAGRCDWKSSASNLHGVFQSAPGQLAGRCLGSFVSIPV